MELSLINTNQHVKCSREPESNRFMFFWFCCKLYGRCNAL